jgi:hypothetical protein
MIGEDVRAGTPSTAAVFRVSFSYYPGCLVASSEVKDSDAKPLDNATANPYHARPNTDSPAVLNRSGETVRTIE